MKPRQSKAYASVRVSTDRNTHHTLEVCGDTNHGREINLNLPCSFGFAIRKVLH